MSKNVSSKCISICYLLCLSLLFVGCSSQIKRQDGPPRFYVDETKVPNAKPKVERLSKYGNMHSYVVFGKRYHVMRSSKNYDETGVASWYGTKFHRRSTSSGERYNMLAMTAAHKSLPLPTYVRVTNLHNQRSVIVKVNDRGPFESNRLIDLSYVAAKKLGMLGHGTAHVRVTAIDPCHYDRQLRFAERSRPPLKHYRPRSANNTSSWQVVENRRQANSTQAMYLQVGAFKTKANALRLQKKLMALLHTNVTITPPYANKPLFRVKIGPLRDQALANRLTVRLKHLGFTPNRIYGA